MRRLFFVKDKGFILLGMLFVMVLMAITALALNRRAGLQAKMAANQTRSTQIYLGQLASVQEATWQLTKHPYWWQTTESGQDYAYNGTAYSRIVTKARDILPDLPSSYDDVIIVSVNAKGADTPLRSFLRYYINPPLQGPTEALQPHQVCRDQSDNLYFADPFTHRVYKRDATTGQTIAVAGDGTSGYSGNGGPATQAKLNSPNGVAVDLQKNIYIADTGNCWIRKVDALTGSISKVAGHTYFGLPDCGDSGDGDLATSAELNSPYGVAVDLLGNIYIADTGNHRIRKLDSAGVITTVAGTGIAGYSEGGPATSAKLNGPQGVGTDAGNIYIADTDNHCIRKVDNSGIISTVAGRGTLSVDGVPATSALLEQPKGVFADSGDIYLADTNNHKIKKVDSATQTINTIAGTGSAGYSGDGGPATSAKLDRPSGVCLNGAGEIIISDTLNGCLRHAFPGGSISSLFLPGGLGLTKPQSTALDANGNLYIADTDNNRVRKLDTEGRVTTVAGTGSAGDSGDNGPAINGRLNKPSGVAVDSWGNIYVADTENHRIRKVNTSGIITTVAGTGSNDYSGDGGPATSARLDKPEGVAVHSLGSGPSVRIYIADTNNHCIRKVDTSGIITTVAGQGKKSGDEGDGGSATYAKLNKPRGLALNYSEHIFIADSENDRVRKVDSSQVITTVAGTGSDGYNEDGIAATAARLHNPYGVFVDSAGNLFIADKDNHRLRVVSAHNDRIYTLAGTGSDHFNGDNKPAVEANLDRPGGVAMASTRGGGKIYIADTDNNRIRVLTFETVKELY